MAKDTSLDKQVISEYARRDNVSYQEAERRLKIMISTIRDVFLLVGIVTLRRLGTLRVTSRKNAKFKNNHTGMTEMIPMIKVIRFKPAKCLKEELNNKVKDDLLSRFKK